MDATTGTGGGANAAGANGTAADTPRSPIRACSSQDHGSWTSAGGAAVTGNSGGAAVPCDV